MADLLSQDEIDNLLNSTITTDETSTETVEGTKEKVQIKMRTFSFKRDKNIRFLFPYQSPVIKRGNFLFNPDPDKENDENKVVVRSLENYVGYLKHNRNL
ncbi:MAG: hypothetical protein HWN67_11785 [Candidatus Helarchaeota archaeon]|nr:hypothetical protein [Candidatus Helarchaeota archaeon]